MPAVSDRPPRVLIADRAPERHPTLEPALRRAGWSVLTVRSSLDVLRTVRDAEVSLLLIDPGLPGAGVTGVDVVRTLKSASRFRDLPVFFLLTAADSPPPGMPAAGVLVPERMPDEALLTALVTALQRPRPPERAPTNGGQGRPVTDADLEARVLQAAEAALTRLATEEVRTRIEAVVREVARELVPSVAERLIRAEIERLRAEYGLGEAAG